MKQGESERLEEEYDGGQPGERRRQGDPHHPSRHGRRRHWFRSAVNAIWYVLLAVAAVSAVYHLLLAT